MQVANIQNPVPLDYRQAFPNSSFDASGPDDQFLAEAGYARVSLSRTYNHETEKLVPSEPYYEAPWVYTVRVEPLTANELAERNNAKLEEIQTRIVNQTQTRLDQFANTRHYSNVDSLGKYKDITDQEINQLTPQEQPLVLKFRTECRYLCLATASTWARLYLILDEVRAGTRPVPNDISDIETDLPPLVWPDTP